MGRGSVVQHELGEPRDGTRRPKEAGVPRHPTESRGVWIVHDAGDRVPVPQAGRRRAPLELLRWPEQHHLIDPQWPVHLARHERVERESTDAAHDFAE